MGLLIKCTTCGVKESHETRLHATLQGWTIAEVAFEGKVKYSVNCSKCQPKWVTALIAEAKKNAT